MNKTKLLVIFGGASPEYYQSCNTAGSVVKHIDSSKYDVHVIGITKEGVWYYTKASGDQIFNGEDWIKHIDNIPATISFEQSKKGILIQNEDNKYDFIPIDIALPVINGITGEDGSIQGLLEIAGIPYVGSNVLSSACCLDKEVTRYFTERINIPLADCEFYDINKQEDINNIVTNIKNRFDVYPLFIKPTNTGSSIGISRVDADEEIEKAVIKALKYSDVILVEEGIIGSELKVSMIGNEKIEFGSILQITVDKDSWYDYDKKYVDKSEVEKNLPANISDELLIEAQRLSAAVFNQLKCSDYARCDLFLKDGKLYFNEINTVPAFSEFSNFSLMFNDVGLSYPQMLDKLIQTAHKRYQK